jgi:RimJ/RimL family protein N-acetyltransferase
VPALFLRRATEADIPFVMETERKPGYEKTLGRFEHDRHATLLADPSWIYLVAPPHGIALFNEVDEPQKNICLKRFAVSERGAGYGSQLLPAALNFAFTETDAHRVWLRLVEKNEAALALYRKFGFVEEGMAREAGIAPDGSRFSFIVMSILRPEWASRRG